MLMVSSDPGRRGPDAIHRLREGKPVGVRLSVEVGAVPGLSDGQHPLHQPIHIRIVAARHAQSEIPRIAVHAKQVRAPFHEPAPRPDHPPDFPLLALFAAIGSRHSCALL